MSNYNRIARVDKVRHGDHRVVPSCELLHRDDPIETRSPIDEMARYNPDKVVQRYEVTQVLVRTSSSYCEPEGNKLHIPVSLVDEMFHKTWGLRRREAMKAKWTRTMNSFFKDETEAM